MILVKIGKLNGKVVEMALADGTTIGQALAKAPVYFNPGTEDVEIHGEGIVNTSSVVGNGDLIVVIPKVIRDPLIGKVADMLDAEFGVDLDLDNQNDYNSIASLIKLIKEG